MDEAFISLINLWPLNWAPRNWAFCWGQTISIQENTTLFSLIGTTYGGDGVRSFILPDFRGRVPVGSGRIHGGLAEYQLGMMGGQEVVTLQQTHMPAHTHQAVLASVEGTFKASTSGGTTSTPDTTNKTLAAAKDGRKDGDFIYNSSTPDIDLNGIAINGGSVEVQNTGQGQYHENRQPFAVANYIMCMQGLYPQRQ